MFKNNKVYKNIYVIRHVSSILTQGGRSKER